jgi:hypothetical protein
LNDCSRNWQTALVFTLVTKCRSFYLLYVLEEVMHWSQCVVLQGVPYYVLVCCILCFTFTTACAKGLLPAEATQCTDVESQFPCDKIRTLALYIVPSRLNVIGAKKKIACCCKLDRQRWPALDCLLHTVGLSTAYSWTVYCIQLDCLLHRVGLSTA